jgi:hypothetical protein
MGARRSCLLAAAVLGVALLASCASTPPRKVLTIELFDSSAGRPAEAGEAGVSWALPVYNLPAETAVRKKEQAAPAPVATPPAAEEPPFDAALSIPIRPRTRASFPLETPAAPEVAPAGGAPVAAAAQARAPAKSKGTKSATAAVAPKAGAATSPAAVTPAPATGPAATAATAPATGPAATAATPQAPTTAAPTAPAADTYGRLREIYARQGDDVQVGLDALGFLFLGFPDKSPQSDGMSFKGKETRSGKTWFTFKALKLGTYDLDFLQQQNSTGTSARETVRVHVVSDADFTTAVSQGPQGSEIAPTAGEHGDPAFAERLTGIGQYEAAVSELLKGYREGNPALNDQIASLYMRMRSWDPAAKYYMKNVSPQGSWTARAVLGLVRVAAAQKDQALLMSMLQKFLEIRDPQSEEPLILALRMERDRGEVGVGLDLAQEYAERFPMGRWIDEAQFILGSLLEADSQFRDLSRARDTYRDLLKIHPESAYADTARERLRYIERHFYQVR